MNEIAVNNEFVNQLQVLVHQQQEQNTLFKLFTQRLEFLEKQQPLSPIVISFIGQLRKKRVIEVLGGKASKAYQDRRLTAQVYREAARDFKQRFRIPRYDLVRNEDRDAALAFWQEWIPAAETLVAINKTNA